MLVCPVCAGPAESTPFLSGTDQAAQAWRDLDPDWTLYLDLPGGRVVIELSPQFAPRLANNLRALVRAGYFNGASILRVDDRWVLQWGFGQDPPIPAGVRAQLEPEFERPLAGLTPNALPDRDAYAPMTGFVDGWPVAWDPASGLAWLPHCYAMLGAGRGVDVNSGSGTSPYVVIGANARRLDRNVTLAGRVVYNMGLLSGLERGRGPQGAYAEGQHPVAVRVTVAADLPGNERMNLQVMLTNSPEFRARIASLRRPSSSWYRHAPSNLDICAIEVPVRLRPPA